MYNEDLKMRFIKQYTASKNMEEVCINTFKAIEPYEVAWDADICTKQTEDLRPITEELIGIRMRSTWTRVGILNEYVRWCIKIGVPGACDGMLHAKPDGIDAVRHRMVASPLHLQVYLDSICAPEEQATTDNIYRCFYWLAYGGVDEEDILKIKCDDVDFHNMVVRYGDMEIPLYRESLPAFKNCVYLTQFAYDHPNYDKVIYKDRVDGDTVVRGIRGASSTKAMRVALSRRSKEKIDDGSTDLKLSYFRVWLSGLFYRMYERERAGIPVNFAPAVEQFMEGKTYKLDSGRNTIDAKKRQFIKEYTDDYERWKLAFSI